MAEKITVELMKNPFIKCLAYRNSRRFSIGKPRVDHLRGAVWGVRASLGNRIVRTLFSVEGGQMVLLHGFIKKTQQTQNADIELAERRYREWHHGET